MLSKIYKDLLKSDRWKDLKKIYQNGSCWICNSKENLNIHHFCYKKKLFFDPENLVLLCEICHKNLHFSSGEKDIHKNFNTLKEFKRNFFDENARL